MDIDEDTKFVIEWFWEDRYGTLELNVSAMGVTVEEKEMSHQRKQANAEVGVVVLVVVTHPPRKNKHENLCLKMINTNYTTLHLLYSVATKNAMTESILYIKVS